MEWDFGVSGYLVAQKLNSMPRGMRGQGEREG
jgi:hypothetical protein